MQVVGAAFSGMLWLQSWDNYSHAAGLSSSCHAYTWSSISAYSGSQCSWKPQQVASKRVADRRLDVAFFVLPKSAGVVRQVEL